MEESRAFLRDLRADDPADPGGLCPLATCRETRLRRGEAGAGRGDGRSADARHRRRSARSERCPGSPCGNGRAPEPNCRASVFCRTFDRGNRRGHAFVPCQHQARMANGPRVALPGDDPEPVLMNREEWQRVKDVLHEALELPPADRPAFLDSRCESAEFRAEVESLLDSYEDAGTFIEGPAASVSRM